MDERETGVYKKPFSDDSYNNRPFGCLAVMGDVKLRDWFAGMAMSQILIGRDWSDYETLSIEAYKIADAMLHERVKGSYI